MRKQRHGQAMCCLLLGLWVGLPLRAQAPAASSNLFIGSWKLNVEKSKLATPPPREFTSIRTYRKGPGGVMLHSITNSYARGGGFTFAAVKYDGNEYSVFDAETLGAFLTNHSEPATTVSFTQPDDHTLEYTDKKNGNVIGRGTSTVSPDGKSIVENVRTFNSQGEETSTYSLLYDRL